MYSTEIVRIKEALQGRDGLMLLGPREKKTKRARQSVLSSKLCAIENPEKEKKKAAEPKASSARREEPSAPGGNGREDRLKRQQQRWTASFKRYGKKLKEVSCWESKTRPGKKTNEQREGGGDKRRARAEKREKGVNTGSTVEARVKKIPPPNREGGNK